ncbi:hypothetical protein NEIRO03_1422 [Nematocida sp. AWRm78]|nr:hypothetical protein NEIRO02_0728 [Nematocida sp. AWRm79]KAI5183949.1 hypothetical protein NEIRO03_1422 [Nematocida sp. AWRm78]
MERSDRLLKELHEKEDVIAELKENSRKERDRIGVLYKKVGALQEEIERLKELLRSTKKHLSIYERKAASAEKRGKVQTKKALSLVKEPQSTLTSRILVLESIIRELGSQLNLPVNEIIALSEICTENDPLLKNVLQNNEENDNNEDLIDYLDKNGVNSILGIEIDRSGID